MGTSAVTHCAVENRLEHFSMALLHCPYKVDNFRLLTFKVSQFDLSGLRYEAETAKNRMVGSHFLPLCTQNFQNFPRPDTVTSLAGINGKLAGNG